MIKSKMIRFLVCVLDEAERSTDLLGSHQAPASDGQPRLDWRKPLLPHSFKTDSKHCQSHVSNVCFICNDSLPYSALQWAAVCALLEEHEGFYLPDRME